MLKLKFLLLLLFLIILPIKLASSSDNLNERFIDNLEDHDVINNLEERAFVSPNSPNSLNPPNVMERTVENDLDDFAYDDDFDKRDTSPANILEKRAPYYRCGKKCYFHHLPYSYENYAPCYPNCGCGCGRCYCYYGKCKCIRYYPH